MSHPNPSHDRKNEYPSDDYMGSRKKALNKKSGDNRGSNWLSGSERRKEKHQSLDSHAIEHGRRIKPRADGGLEKPVKKMLDLSDIGGKVGSKAEAIKKKIGGKSKFYIGHSNTPHKREVFGSKTTPTKESHPYGHVRGPFKTKKQAEGTKDYY